jgi:hypothetical protein
MSLRRVDPRFCLPRPPRTAIVLDGLEGWRSGLEQAGVEIANFGAHVDLVVAPASQAERAIACGSEMVILEGHGGARRLRRAGLVDQLFLVRPSAERPDFLLPLHVPDVAAYAVRMWSASYSRHKGARNRLASLLLRVHAFPEIGPVVAVGLRRSGHPYVVRAAERLGVPRNVRWLLAFGQADALSRNVFHLFEEGTRTPSRVLKFSRVPGYDDPFLRDERGLSIAHETGGVAALHAPTLLGRFQVDGLEASLETAACGPKLRDALLAPGSEASKLELVEEVAAWLVDVAESSAAGPDRLAHERRRLLEDVIPAWRGSGVGEDLVRDLPPVAAVLQHNDLGAWNIVVSDSGFTAVDWEAARRFGLPVWDLLYFLTDALATLDRTTTSKEQDEHTRLLLRGDLRRSPLLFDWVRRMVGKLDIPERAVGPIATLAWLHHGLSHVARETAIQRFGSKSGLPAPAGRIAPFWLSDPLLGPEWKAWHRA